MKSEQNWATAVMLLDLLTLGPVASDKLPDPRLQLENLTRNSFSGCAPSESYSLNIPSVPQSSIHDDFLPIDVLYGSYDPRSRRIAVYVESIERYKRAFRCSFEDFLHIVRLHEYAHALVHLGIRPERRDGVLYQFNTGDRSDWRKFLLARRAAFSSLDNASHEFIAQALTYAGVLALPEADRSRLTNVFDRIELRQPNHYRLSTEVKGHIERARWDILLDAARRDADAYRAPGFDLRTGLEQLVCFSPDESAKNERPRREWAVVADESLSSSLNLALNSQDLSSSDDSLVEFEVDRFNGLKIEIFAREHPPPHFRVNCAGESANFRIDDCSLLDGNLRLPTKKLRRWHEANRVTLIETWNRLRPSDCPVGAFRTS